MSNVSICSKPKYKLRLRYGVKTSSMHAVTYLLDTRAGINCKPMIHPQYCTNCIKRGKMPHLCKRTQEPLRIVETILLHVRLGDLRVEVWFGIVHNLAVDILIGTPFIDCFTRGIFLAECKVVPWHSHPVEIFSFTQRDQHICTST